MGGGGGRWVMKLSAIKGFCDRLSSVHVSLRSSRAPKLINHQGGAEGFDHCCPQMPPGEEGNHQPISMCCYFNHYFPPRCLSLKPRWADNWRSSGCGQSRPARPIKELIKRKTKEEKESSVCRLIIIRH